ncbi:glycine betaine ABC transporter substrate-binding protein [Borrelia miyamotoi]|uniref:Glycine betaine ABC transporter substrate-binding protein n=1 Tax=Borrelia miyamotoi TaxID=47466 RepID=A0AAP8YS59_9SPIR|nr:glycine betaine ABC transporter substrate-binding protein [Borrelia miyamotoi]AHH05273.1 Glycine betaine-binding protein [Borrelia miyamotoi FR64b]ATQ15040.1 glycine betaine ABC transporter substrate-binding protein [Borrelia miyamotoi]ATQ16223.1 glycine betaine ABC transporter substrate-binding protein [Borrelia miyamotoi]ATQ17368.1 glycine betaine ABC transporter substrate-binding protein [Borrelia miyamotoi]ATQ18130.1 glycine betaine ABC transporter substrate-binding protein [Borrelia mi
MRSLLISIFISFILVLFSCDKNDNSNNDNSKDLKLIKIAYVNWIGETVATNIIKVIFEKMGYKAEIFPVTTSVMYQYLSLGQVDGMVSAWVPTADKFYYEKFKDKFVDLGANYEGTLQGFVVPSYVTISNIAELKGRGAEFKNKMVGIDAGAGTQLSVEKTLNLYGLDQEYELISSSESVMLASLESAIKKNEWILVPLWKPHWAFAEYDIKFLDDPLLAMGGPESIHSLVRIGLKEDDPDAYYLFDNFYWNDDLLLPLIEKNYKKSGHEYTNAVEFVDFYKEYVKNWVPDKYKSLFD